jgi:hypothetical protein
MSGRRLRAREALPLQEPLGAYLPLRRPAQSVSAKDLGSLPQPRFTGLTAKRLGPCVDAGF